MPNLLNPYDFIVIYEVNSYDQQTQWYSGSIVLHFFGRCFFPIVLFWALLFYFTHGHHSFSDLHKMIRNRTPSITGVLHLEDSGEAYSRLSPTRVLELGGKTALLKKYPNLASLSHLLWPSTFKDKQ